MSDDYSDDIFTSGKVLLGGSFTRGIHETQADDDWFKITLDKYFTFVFLIQSDQSSSLAATTNRARVMDSQGNELRRNSANHLERSVRFQATNTGNNYFLSLFHGDGAYQVAAMVVDDFYEPGFSNFISQNEISFGAIEVSGDEDPHKVQSDIEGQAFIGVGATGKIRYDLANHR